ncbi:Protein of unknown function DUF4735 [Cinara cedri]|uniref:Uncharacterized protein n=1 Tax=Cinara cedri TaxID=506608 RepID=A0A5E4NRG9_9HEMI|nr:Protein of unknown function DUF4735 [Cinara cedri]
MMLYATVVVYLPLMLFFTAVNGKAADFGDELNVIRNAETRIIDLIESTIQCYLSSGVDNNVDLNLMLGVSIMKGQFMSCGNRSQFNYFSDFNRKSRLSAMVDELYKKFYENNIPDLDTTWKILDPRLWMSTERIVRKSHKRARLPAMFDVDSLTDGDQYFRDISDECLRQAITTCQITPECIQPELLDNFFGYAHTHQVLYLHVLKKKKCNSPIFPTIVEKIALDKCNMIFIETLYIANDPDLLEKFKDLFIEQIAICGMLNMEDFIRLEWLSVVFTTKNVDCGDVQRKNNNLSPQDSSHLAGVSLAALGTYWKFLCYDYGTDNTK